MKLFSSFRRCLFHLFFISALSLALLAASVQAKEHVKIGVLAFRGAEEAIARWSPTAEHLTSMISGYSFEIVPLDLKAMREAAGRREVDFVITNPGNYVELEFAYGASRIATLKTLQDNKLLKEYGAAIFTKAGRTDIKDLKDLKGKKIMAVEKEGFGSWRVPLREFKDHGMDPFRDFAGIEFAGLPQDLVVYGVRDGKADAGSVRTGFLESMAAEGKIDISDFRVLNLQKQDDFPFLLSTRLYPEWAFAKMRDTQDGLAEQVVVALIEMPQDSKAARAAKIAGWTVPLDYQSVHELMKELRIPPYEDYGKVTFSQALRKYWFWFVIAFAAMFVMGGVSVYVLRLRAVVVQLRLAEDQLREKTDIFRHVFESANVGKSITLPAGEINVNKAFADMLGYTQEELRNKARQDLTPSDEIDAVQKRLAPLLSGERDSTRFEKRYIHKSGSHVWADISVAIHRDVERKPLYFITTVVDITERKKAEHDRQKFVMLADSSSEFIGMCDLDLNPIYVNPAGVCMVGLPDMAAACRVKVQDYFFPEDQKFIAEEFFPRVMREGHGEVEIRLRHFQTSEPIWMTYYLFHVREASGALVGWATVSHDITERRKAEEELRKSQELLQGLIDHAPSVIYIKDRQGRFITINRRFEELFNMDRHEARGRTDFEYFPKEIAQRFRDVDIEVISGKKPRNAEEVAPHPDGLHTYLSVKFPLLDEKGEAYALCGISTDITDIKKAEEELRITNEELLAINRIITTTTTTTGVKQTLESTLDEALNITGLEGGTICMVTPEQTLHLIAHRETSEATIRDLMENEIKIGDCLCGECAKDHKPLILHNREEVLQFATREAARGEDIRFHAAFPLIMGEKCLGVLCIFTRTDRKPSARSLKLLESVSSQIAIAVDNAQMFDEISQHAATLEDKVRLRTIELQASEKALTNIVEDLDEKSKALQKANEKLKEIDRLKSVFIASMSHELRTPLNSVIGFSSVLLNRWAGEISGEQENILKTISRSGNHLLALINDVIDVSKIEAGNIDVYPEDFELDELINEAMAMMKKDITEKKLVLKAETFPLTMHTDRRRLFQCIVNLLSNATKFTIKGGISIKSHSTDNRVRITVSDTGIGIREEDIQHLFKSFVRLDSPLRTTVLGTGLGLYLAKKLANEALQGDITVRSRYGEGSAFTLEIPITMGKDRKE